MSNLLFEQKTHALFVALFYFPEVGVTWVTHRKREKRKEKRGKRKEKREGIEFVSKAFELAVSRVNTDNFNFRRRFDKERK